MGRSLIPRETPGAHVLRLHADQSSKDCTAPANRGTGKDSVCGGRSGDVAPLGGGEAAFVWDLGDDNDVIEG